MGNFPTFSAVPKFLPRPREQYEYMHVDSTVKASDVIGSLRLMEDASCC